MNPIRVQLHYPLGYSHVAQTGYDPQTKQHMDYDVLRSVSGLIHMWK